MEKYTILKKLVIKSFHIDRVVLGERTNVEKGTITINRGIIPYLLESEKEIDSINISVIPPNEREIWVNSIMDIIPISTKVLGRLGEGITHTLTGVYVMLTGADTEGKQMAEFGSSEGILKNSMMFGRAGTPDINDHIIHFDVILKSNCLFDRTLPLAAHRSCDKFIQEIRDVLKKLDGRGATEVNQYYDRVRPDGKKVVIIKQIAGQGAMYDNQLFPNEPSGLIGGKSIIDIGNVPLVISPNEYRDGALRSMT